MVVCCTRIGVCMCISVCVCAPRVTRHDDDALGIFDHLHRLVHVHLCVGPGDLHGLAGAGGGSTVAAQDDVRQGAIHSLVPPAKICNYPTKALQGSPVVEEVLKFST